MKGLYISSTKFLQLLFQFDFVTLLFKIFLYSITCKFPNDANIINQSISVKRCDAVRLNSLHALKKAQLVDWRSLKRCHQWKRVSTDWLVGCNKCFFKQRLSHCVASFEQQLRTCCNPDGKSTPRCRFTNVFFFFFLFVCKLIILSFVIELCCRRRNSQRTSQI